MKSITNQQVMQVLDYKFNTSAQLEKFNVHEVFSPDEYEVSAKDRSIVRDKIKELERKEKHLIESGVCKWVRTNKGIKLVKIK